jgi:hypothetical protein
MSVSVYVQVYTCIYSDILCISKDVLGYTLYELVCTCTYLWSLTRGVIRITPQDDLRLLDLLQNAVCLLKFPLPLFACLVRQVPLQEVQKCNSLFLQFGKLCLWNAGLARGDIPVQALNEDIHYIITGISNMRQTMQTAACLGLINGCVDQLDLVYASIYQYIRTYTGIIHLYQKKIPVISCICMHILVYTQKH